MSALLAPTVNSYRRLRPASLAGYWANWGYDHRGVAVRIPGERGPATRIEHRLGDGAANPYVAAATVLQAARLGVENEYALPPAETGDGLETVDTEICVPENLGAALDALEQDDALVSAVGELLVSNFVGIKRKEWDDWLGATTDWELDAVPEFHLTPAARNSSRLVARRFLVVVSPRWIAAFPACNWPQAVDCPVDVECWRHQWAAAPHHGRARGLSTLGSAGKVVIVYFRADKYTVNRPRTGRRPASCFKRAGRPRSRRDPSAGIRGTVGFECIEMTAVCNGGTR